MKETAPRNPTVSIIVPVYNEREYIEKCIQSLMAQDYPDIIEILCVDGGSPDGTRQIIHHVQKDCPKIRLLDNPYRVQTVALNVGIEQAKGEIVARIDAHGFYARDYISQCVAHLIETGAGNVGGAAQPMPGNSLISKLIAFAHESRFGIGVAKFRRRSGGGWVDTVWPGFYWRRVFDEIGLYRPELTRNEDVEFNARLRAHGYGIYLSPQIRAYYFPRQDLRGLWGQNFANGVGAMQTLFVNPQALGLRHLIPFLFVTGLLGSLLITPWHVLGQAALGAIAVAYALGCIVFSLQIGLKHGLGYAALMPFVFFTIHLSYGLGSMWGLAKFGSRRRRNVESHFTDVS